MENGVALEKEGTEENRVKEGNGRLDEKEEIDLKPEKPRRGRPRKKIPEPEETVSSKERKKNDINKINCNGTSRKDGTDNAKIIAVKTEIKKEINEDEEYSAEFLCNTNVPETNGIKVKVYFL